ncbi:amino acid ABC transporter substrate-binding protein [Piscinibacter sp. HJYY11]|nr:amino acid ABC transporter substrate-binding protein [Piscinibacter sp. HJYY11]
MRVINAVVLALPAICVTLCCPAAAKTGSRTLERIQATGVISVGYRTTSAPFSYLDGRRRPIGYSIDICDRIVQAIRRETKLPELRIRMVAVTTATRLPMLAVGNIDLECGVTTHTVERERSVGFSVTTFVSASRLLSRRSAGIQSVDDLRGKTVATTLSTTSMQYLTKVNAERSLAMRIVAGIDDEDAFSMVRRGEAIAFAMDDVLLKSVLAGAQDGQAFTVSEHALTVEPYAIGLPPKDAKFKEVVDRAIKELFVSGEIHVLYKRWFESKIPFRNINLRLPMSGQLRRVVERPTDSPDPDIYR